MKLNLETNAKPKMVKINAQLETGKVLELEQLLKDFKDVFAWTYKDLKGIPPKLAQHKIELDTTIPLTHQTRYKLNPNYATIIKQNINKLLATRFIQFVKEVKWLSPIVVVPKKNGKMKMCIHFRKLNAATKKDPYPLHFIDEVLNIVARYKAYSFLDGYSGYHQICITPKDIYKTAFVTNWGGFYMEVDVVWSEKWTSNISKSYYQSIQRIFGQFYEDISR
jgi:hypothetical protein